MNGFHDILFPLDIALGARGGPERRTQIVELASGDDIYRLPADIKSSGQK